MPASVLGPPGSTPCVVCGTPVPRGAPPVLLAAATASAPLALAVCGQASCRRRVIALPAVVHCGDCGRLLRAPAERAGGRCGTSECRVLGVQRQRRRELDARAAESDVRLRSAARTLRDGEAPRPPASERDGDTPIVLLPSTDPRRFPMRIPLPDPLPARLPRRRARQLRAHVRQLAREAFGQAAAEASLATALATAPRAPAEVPDAADAAAFLGAACSACGGRCCRHGGERAYLTVDTMRRWFAAHPDLGPPAAVAAYAAHLPDTSLRESCVYHTADGCALPRVMRSDTCNRYECDGLAHLGRELRGRAAAGRPLRRAFLAVVEDDAVSRTAWAGTR